MPTKGGKATFNEPGGISAAGGKLYVADTNNHAIRVVELAAPYRVSTLEIEGLTAADGCSDGRRCECGATACRRIRPCGRR